MDFVQFLSAFKPDGELELIRRLFDHPLHKYTEMSLVQLLNCCGEEKTYDDMTQASQQLCDEGNRLFKAKAGKRDVLGACHLYTRAIFAAPEDSGTLALAHANRAMALLEFGYYRQAYDDCVCALELDYREQLRPKILTQQATCALHLGEVAQVQRHLDELYAMKLKGSCLNKVREVRGQLAEFLRQQKNEVQLAVANGAMLALQKRQKIVQTAGPAGRYMVATQAIGQHELIFSDSAAVFVPAQGAMLCQQCARTEFIPFPCKRCRCRVVYCSHKCRAAHAQIHAFECAAYRTGVFDQISCIERLAFRMLLEGLPQAIPMLRHKRDAQALWEALVGKGSDSVAANDSIAYAQMLRLVQHLDNIDISVLTDHVAHVDILLVYLKNCTAFFKLTEGTAATRRNWELLTAALILRHIGQVKVNVAFYCSFVRTDFTHMSDALWSGPLRIQCGRLHQLGKFRPAFLAIFPHLSMCNHVCEHSFVLRYSGRNIHAFALNEVRAGAEITRCCSADYISSKRQSRRKDLKAAFNFECKCAKCERVNPDADYEKSHRYRCDNLKCRQVFVPHLPQQETLDWWHNALFSRRKVPIKCTVCGAEQSFKWFDEMENLFGNVCRPTVRRLLYKSFENLDIWLLDQHELKMSLALKLLNLCLAAHCDVGSRLANAEFTILVRIAKFVLSVTETRLSSFSPDYACRMVILWDLIALGKYRCTRDEFKPMLRAVDLLSDELQTVFMNYYTDYIEPLLLT